VEVRQASILNPSLYEAAFSGIEGDDHHPFGGIDFHGLV
jgi:hypothetical protein